MCENAQISIIPEINETKYFYGNNHRLIGINNSRFINNIGDYGRNLTIATLSLNRSVLTIKLMKSIADNLINFQGELLIIDNGSSKEECNNIQSYIDKMPYKCRLVELDRNYGVAGGRNRTIEYVNTDWVMFLDNDIYFLDNPLAQIQEDISLLGCHFLNLPLLNESATKIFALGGHLYLYINNGEVSIGGGSVYSQTQYSPNTKLNSFLSTFLFGGASIVNRYTFNRLGGFDEGMFIGFEDIDFSIRLFREGYKVGNCGMVCLVHDHKVSSKGDDQDYESKRFSRDCLKKSAEYFEKKHSMRVWNDCVDEWLKEMNKKFNINENYELTKKTVELSSDKRSKRPKIALITDTDNWAFANISKQLERYLGEFFDFKVIPMNVVDNVCRVIMMTKDFDLVHFFWRTHVSQITSQYAKDYINNLGVSYQTFFDMYVKDANISTSVYDHLFLDQDSEEMNNKIFTLASHYYVSSEKLYDIYQNSNFPKKPIATLEDGVDLDLFKPYNLDRLDLKGRKIVIGWSGNSNWANHIEDFKGFHTIIKPVINELIAEGYPIDYSFADRNVKMIPHKEMVEYYSTIDVYVCTSKIEGTPNPVLEAMACGVPVISTDVGIVPQVFGEKQKNFMLKERTISCLKDAIKRIIEDPSLLIQLSEENMKQIKQWDWSIKALGFKDFFNRCLNNID